MTDPQASSLYDRYNGFTLGCFVSAACHQLQLPDAKARFLRHRVTEFLEEAGLGSVEWPATPRQVSAKGLIDAVADRAGSRSKELGDFTKIGAMALLRITHSDALSLTQEKELSERWGERLDSFGLPSARFERWFHSVPKGDDRRELESVLSSASALLALILEVTPADDSTCFVAMPFSEPFLGSYDIYYRKALAGAGFRAIRAWGGLSSEEYNMAMLTLISRCGAVFAELTTMNHNVLHEIGVVHGMVKPAFLVVRDDVDEIPSNLEHLPILTYPAGAAGMAEGVCDRTSEFIRFVWNDYRARVQEADMPGVPS